jgi:hypothetical protein
MQILCSVLESASDMPGETAWCEMPPGMELWTPRTRAQLALEVVDAVMLRLGKLRDWDVDALISARKHVVDSNYEFIYTGPWKSSPDRRHRARLVFRLEDDGYGRVVVDFATKDLEPRGTIGPALAYSTLEGFKRSTRTMHWDSNSTLVFAPWVTPFWDEGYVLADLDDARTEPPSSASQPSDDVSDSGRSSPWEITVLVR